MYQSASSSQFNPDMGQDPPKNGSGSGPARGSSRIMASGGAQNVAPLESGAGTTETKSTVSEATLESKHQRLGCPFQDLELKVSGLWSRFGVSWNLGRALKKNSRAQRTEDLLPEHPRSMHRVCRISRITIGSVANSTTCTTW